MEKHFATGGKFPSGVVRQKMTCSSSDMVSKVRKMESRFFRYSAFDDGSISVGGDVDVDVSDRREMTPEPINAGGLKNGDTCKQNGNFKFSTTPDWNTRYEKLALKGSH